MNNFQEYYLTILESLVSEINIWKIQGFPCFRLGCGNDEEEEEEGEEEEKKVDEKEASPVGT